MRRYGVMFLTGDRLTLTFTSMNVPSTWNCTGDYVKVYDGDDLQAPVSGTALCGDALPSPIVSQVTELCFVLPCFY